MLSNLLQFTCEGVPSIVCSCSVLGDLLVQLDKHDTVRINKCSKEMNKYYTLHKQKPSNFYAITSCKTVQDSTELKSIQSTILRRYSVFCFLYCISILIPRVYYKLLLILRRYSIELTILRLQDFS